MLTTVEAIQACSAKKSAIFPSPIRKHHPNITFSFSSSLDPPTVLLSGSPSSSETFRMSGVDKQEARLVNMLIRGLLIIRIPGYPSTVVDSSRTTPKLNEDHFELGKFLTMSMVKQVLTFPAACSHLFSCKGIHFLALCLNKANIDIVT